MILRKFSLAFLVFSSPSLLSTDFCSQTSKKFNQSRFAHKDERKTAFNRRSAACCLRTLMQEKHAIECEGNGDEKRVPYFAAQFSKTLEHDPVTGLLTPLGQQNYKLMVDAIKTGDQDIFNAIVRAPGASKFINPQGALTFSLEGADSSLFDLSPFPVLSSPDAAAIMLEEYLMVLCRNVYFNEYGTGIGTDATSIGTGSLTRNAAAVLQNLGSAYKGPRNQSGMVDASVLFRSSYGSLIGPYISQFLLLPVGTVIPGGIGGQNLNLSPFTQITQLRPIAGQREFGVSFANFVAIQNGNVPQPYQSSDYDATNVRYIINGRDLASFAHFDTPYEAAYNALTILFALRFPFSKASPYVNDTINNEVPFVTFGICDAYELIGGATLEGIKAAWAQKWRAYRSLRPEAFAGLVHNVKTTGQNPFKLNASLFIPHAGIDVLSLILSHNQQQGASTYMLSQMYPEGSPAHPSYPSGHALIAGAYITVIKAIFDDTVLIKTMVQPKKPDPTDPTKLINLSVSEGANDITLATELDKLAVNICQGRNFGGIHYRADIDEGMLLGEQVAIKYLQDHACTITEQTFKGYELTTLEGSRIRITANSVTVIS